MLDEVIDTGMEWMFRAIFLLGVPLGVGWLVLAFYADVTAQHVSLSNAEWTCVAWHSKNSMIVAGKAVLPTTETVCDRYERMK